VATAGRQFVINLLANSDPAEKAFRRVGEAAGRLPTPLLAVSAAITAGFAATAAAVVKIGGALFELGEQFDNVYDNIRIQTGATGKTLEGLQQSFRDVAAQVPSDFGDIGTVIQDLNTRLGVTGEPLEELALKLLTVSRLMGGDVSSNTRAVTRLFQNFNVRAEDQSGALDLLFRASQASGMAFGELASSVTTNGVALRGLGFNLAQSVGMLALFEREGVDTAGIMSALERSIGNLSKAGKDVPTAFREAIEAIGSASTQAEAFGIASELVGARGAQRLVDAVQNGRLDIDSFTASIRIGGETILGAAEETDGFRESWANFKNYLKLQLEPAATAVFTEMEVLVAGLIPAVDRVKEAFERDGLQGALAQVSVEWNKVYEERIKPLWERFLAFLNETVLPLAIQAGITIGAGIANGIWDAFVRAIRSKFWSEEISNAVGGVDVFAEMRKSAGLPPSPRTPMPTFTVPRPMVTPLPPPRAGGTLGGSIPFLASGGIVTSPTLSVIGESGPEAVIPLDRLDAGGARINITVNGAIDAEGTARQVLRVLQDAQRRTGVRL
jgi:TP901 family phage tail tape measure protein